MLSLKYGSTRHSPKQNTTDIFFADPCPAGIVAVYGVVFFFPCPAGSRHPVHYYAKNNVLSYPEKKMAQGMGSFASYVYFHDRDFAAGGCTYQYVNGKGELCH
jgi:hypothetical protein